jgi:hypothetical protein
MKLRVVLQDTSHCRMEDLVFDSEVVSVMIDGSDNLHVAAGGTFCVVAAGQWITYVLTE